MNTVQIMNDEFTTWLNRELKMRGWSHRQLGEKAKVSGAAISAVISGVRNPGWDLIAAIAVPLGKPPLELFRLAGLLPEESRGEDEPALLYHYRQLSPPNQRAALAMLRGLAGQPSPPALPPAKGADADDVCKLLARLDSDKLQQAAGFIRWLIEQPETTGPAERPPAVTWEDFKKALASLPSDERETAAMNLLRRYARQGDSPDESASKDSESGPSPHQDLTQGSLL